MRMKEIVTTSGRTYEIHDYANISYASGWMYIKDDNGDNTLGFRKENIEVVVWDKSVITQKSANSNASY